MLFTRVLVGKWDSRDRGDKHAVFTQQSLTETHDSGRGEHRERRNTLEIKDTTTRVNMVRRAFTHELYNLGRKPERIGRPRQNFPLPRERLYWTCKTVNQPFLNSVFAFYSNTCTVISKSCL